jgi:plastocyanin
MARQRTLIAVAVLALAAVACAKNETTTSGTGTSSPTPGASPLVNKGTADATAVAEKFAIELDNEGSAENYFKPTFIKARAGQVLALQLKNTGTNPHTFTITSLNVNEQLDPGASKDVNVTLPAAATADLQFFCSFHSSLGMRGAFFFGTAPQTSAGSTSGGSGSGSGDTDSY